MSIQSSPIILFCVIFLCQMVQAAQLSLASDRVFIPNKYAQGFKIFQIGESYCFQIDSSFCLFGQKNKVATDSDVLIGGALELGVELIKIERNAGQEFFYKQKNLVILTDELSARIKAKKSTIIIREYLEIHPLARAEWIKVLGIILNVPEKAFQLFDQIEFDYNNVNVKNGKKVLVGSDYFGEWKCPNKRSDLAQILVRAGGELVCHSSFSTEQFVLMKDSKLVWLPQNSWRSRREMENFKMIYKNKVEENKIEVFFIKSQNEYWKKRSFRPDLLLKDYSSIMNNQLDQLKFYTK